MEYIFFKSVKIHQQDGFNTQILHLLDLNIKSLSLVQLISLIYLLRADAPRATTI